MSLSQYHTWLRFNSLYLPLIIQRHICSLYWCRYHLQFQARVQEELAPALCWTDRHSREVSFTWLEGSFVSCERFLGRCDTGYHLKPLPTPPYTFSFCSRSKWTTSSRRWASWEFLADDYTHEPSWPSCMMQLRDYIIYACVEEMTADIVHSWKSWVFFRKAL